MYRDYQRGLNDVPNGISILKLGRTVTDSMVSSSLSLYLHEYNFAITITRSCRAKRKIQAGESDDEEGRRVI